MMEGMGFEEGGFWVEGKELDIDGAVRMEGRVCGGRVKEEEMQRLKGW